MIYALFSNNTEKNRVESVINAKEYLLSLNNARQYT